MKRKNRNKKFLISFVALFVLLFGIGYAYLTQKLDITGYLSVTKSMTCPIVFDNVLTDNITSNVEANEPAARSEENKTIIDFDLDLNKPGDVYSFTFDVKNEGPENKCVDTCISNIELIILDSNSANFTDLELVKIKNAIKYELVYDNTDIDVLIGNVLPGQQTKKMRFSVKYSNDINVSDILDKEYDIKASLIITYSGDDKEGCPVDKHTLTVDPDGGTWRESTEIRYIKMAEREKEIIENPVKVDPDDGDELPFMYWNRTYVDYTTDEEGNVSTREYTKPWYPEEDNFVFEMPNYDVTIKAEYKSKECDGLGYKAQNIDTEVKYCWLQDAIDDASDGQGIRLLKNTDESPYNNTPTNNKNDIYIDLNGYSLYGTFINPENTSVQIYHGQIQALGFDTFEYNGTTYNKGVGFVNDGTFIMGKFDDKVEVEDSISIVGIDTALKQNGEFIFYDGYLEGYKGLAGSLGNVTNCPMATCAPDSLTGTGSYVIENSTEKYYVISQHINAKDRQKVYLSTNIGRAVAVGNVFYYNLQDGIIDQTEIVNPAKELRIVRDQWQGAYKLEIPEDNTININMDGFEFTIGNDINVKGTLNVYNRTDKDDTDPRINVSESINVTGTLNVDGLEIKGTTNKTVISNNGDLNIESGRIVSIRDAYAVINTRNSRSLTLGTGALIDNENSSNKNSLLNQATNKIVLGNGTVYGLENQGNLLLTDVFRGRDKGNGYAVSNVGTLEVNSNDIDVPKLLNTSGTLIYREAGVTYTDFRGGTGYVYSGTYTSADDEVIHLSGGTFNIEGGLFNTSLDSEGHEVDCALINAGARLNLNGGTIEGIVSGLCNQAGNSFQYGATITGQENAILAGAAGGVYIQGGETVGDQFGIYMTRSKDGAPYVEVNGGHVEGKNQDGIKAGVGGLTINGGTIEGKENGLSNPYRPGKFACTFYGCSEPSDANVAVPQINGGFIKGGTYGIYNEYIVNFGYDDRDIKVDLPHVYGSEYGIYNSTYGKDRLDITDRSFNFYDGSLSGIQGAYFYEENGEPEHPRNAIEADIAETIVVITDEDNETYLENGTYETKYNALVDPYLQINDDDSVLYTSLDRASKAASAGDTIKVIKDVEIAYPQAFVQNKNVTFDINGHKVKYDYDTTAYSNVVVTDSVGTGKLTLAKDFVFRNGGTINSIDIENLYSTVIRNENYYSALTVKNCTILSNNTALASGLINVESGTITSKNGYAYDSKGTISGGTLTSNTTTAVNQRDTLYVTGGTINAPNGISINSNSRTLYFSDGTVNSNGCGITTAYNLEFSGGLINSNTDGICVICGDHTANITGGKVVAENFGVNSNGTIRLGVEDDTVSIETPVIIGKEKGIYQNGRKFEWFDGIVKSIYKRYDGIISLVPNTYVVFDDEEDIDGTIYRTAYLDNHINFLKVGNQEFNNFNDAVKKAYDTGNTIYLIRDAREEMREDVPLNYDITFDLNGHSLITTQPIIVNGKLTLNDSKGNGAINNIRFNVFTVNSTGEIVFNGGTYTGSYEDYVVVSSGVITLNNGTLHNENYNVVSNSGEMYVHGGEISTSGYCGRSCYPYNSIISKNGTVLIDGGLISDTYGDAISSGVKVTMNGGEINAGGTGITVNEVEMNGGLIKASVSGISSGTLTVMNGGKIEAGSNGIQGPQTVIINGGEINSTKDGISGVSNLTVNEGIIKSSNYNGISNGNTALIVGGYIEGGQYGVYNSGNLTLGVKDGDVHITPPVIVGDINGLYIYSSGDYNATTSFYDGILKGQIKAYTATFTETEVDTAPTLDHELINDIEYETAYLVNDVEFVENLRTHERYKNLQTAVTEAQPNDTLQIIASAPIYYDVVVEDDDVITLDFNDFVISTTKGITNHGTLNLIDSSEGKKGTISTAVVQNLLMNTGELNISNLGISNTYSSRYIIVSSGTLNLNEVELNGINAIDNSGELTVTNSNIKVSNTGIYNKNKMDITGGKIESNNYDIYSISNDEVNITGTTFDMIGNDWYRSAIYLASGQSTVTLDDITILHGWLNNKSGNTVLLKDSLIKYAIYNDGNMTIDNTEVDVNCNDTKEATPYWPYARNTEIAIENHGTLNVQNGTEINADYDSSKSGDINAISTNTTVNISDSTINIGYEGSGRIYTGINAYGNANVVIDNTDIHILAAGTAYGIYQTDASSRVNLKTGHILIENTSLAYGIYISTGETTYGVSSGGLEEVGEDEVDRLNPLVEAYGTQGIGIKKVNGKFYYYDGKIIASTHSLPETASDIEHNWEATTYFDINTGNEYTVLEYMLEDYNYAMVARLNGVYYTTLQSAIDHVDSERNRVEVLKNITEDVTIPEGTNVKLDINNHRVTGKQVNEGTLTLINGSLTNYADTALINHGTLIMGVNDGNYKLNNVFIYVEGLYDFDTHSYLGDKAVISDGEIKFYDGYIEGLTAVDGNITSKAVGYQVHTEHVEVQPTTYCDPDIHDSEEDKAKCEELNEVILYEKKYLVEYTGSDETCDNGHYLYLDPADGTYNGNTGVYKVCLEKTDVYPVNNAKLEGQAFKGWNETSDTHALNSNVITMGDTDIELLAQYESDSSKYVAQINEDPYYYISVNSAIIDADETDTINLLKDVTENIENDKHVTINLNEHTITGSIINNSYMTLNNGSITSTTNAITNYGTLTIGVNDNEISDTSIIVTGTKMGIINDGTFNYFDGTITGGVSKVDTIPENTYVYTTHEDNTSVTRLVNTEPDALCKTKVGTPLYFDNIQDGFNSVGVSRHTLYLLKDADINYELNTETDRVVTFDMQGFNITTNKGGSIRGEFTLKSTSDERAVITMSSNPFKDFRTMTVNNVYLNQTSNGQKVIMMYGVLNMVNSKTNATNHPSIQVGDNGEFKATEVNVDADSEVATASHWDAIHFYQNSNMIEIKDGLFTNGIGTDQGKVTISENTKVVSVRSQEALKVVNGTMIINNADVTCEIEDCVQISNGGTLTINGGTFKTNSTADNMYSLLADAGTVTVNGGTFISNSNGIYARGSNLTVNGGEFISKLRGLHQTAGTVNLGTNDETVSQTIPNITGKDIAIVQSGGTLNMYDGIFKGNNIWTSGEITNVPKGYSIINGVETLEDETVLNTMYLAKTTDFLQVGDETFNNLDDASAAVTETNKTITLIEDASVKFEQKIQADYDVTIDLNGHTLSSDKSIKSYGNVTITDDTADKAGSITNTKTNALVNVSGNLTIEEGIYSSSCSGCSTIANDTSSTDTNKTIHVVNAKILSSNGYGLNGSRGNLIVDNATITSKSYSIFADTYATNNIKITGGTYTSTGSYTLYVTKAAKVEITGGTFNSNLSDNNPVNLTSVSNIIVTGGTYNVESSNSAFAVTSSSGTISGGTYNSPYAGLYFNGGTLNVTGGTYNSPRVGIHVKSGTLNLTGGILVGEQYGIYTEGGTTNIGTRDRTISISSPDITGELYAVYNSAGTVNFYDGFLKYKTGITSGLFNAIEDDTYIYTYEEDGYYKSYLKNADPFVRNKETLKEYTNLQTAIDEQIANEELELIDDFIIYNSVTIPNKNVVLDMNGHTLSITKAITNNGNLTLTTETPNTALLKELGSVDLITNASGKTLTIQNVNLTNVSSKYVIANNGTLSLDNSKITSEAGSGIYNSDTFTITDTDIASVSYGLYDESSSKTNLYDGGTITSDSTAFYVKNAGTRTFNQLTIDAGSIQNTSSATMRLNNITTVGGISNSATLIMDTVTQTIATDTSSYTAITNSGTMTVTSLDLDAVSTGSELIGISNSGTLELVDVSIDADGLTVKAINNTGGTLTIGESDSSVSTMNPHIKAIGTTSGLGINATAGIIYFNDGEIIGSNAFDHDTIIPTGYIKRTYYLGSENYYRTILEIENSVITSNYVAYANKIYYEKLQRALDDSNGKVVTLIQDDIEEINNAKDVTLDLNEHTLTGHVVNTNKLVVLNGTITAADGTTIDNSGTFTMMPSGVYIAQEDPYINNTTGTALNNTGIFNFYSGSLEGITSINGKVTTTTSGYRVKRETNEGITKSYLVEGILEVIDYDYTGEYQKFTAKDTGIYQIELWGAQGGTDTGKGGYTSGEIHLNRGDILYVYVGSRGATYNISGSGGGWNGGGNTGNTGTSRAGGGATDVRLVRTEATTIWNEERSLASRIMVAAGGAGAESGSSAGGGGLNGGTAYDGSYATQTSGSAFGYAKQPTYDASGPGGGYWGGTLPGRDSYTAGGGSSYISGHTGAVAIKSANDTTAKVDECHDETIDGNTQEVCTLCETGTTNNECSIHYSGKKFTNTVMIDGAGYAWTNVIGNQIGMTLPNGSTGNGNTGNGHARITVLEIEEEVEKVTYNYFLNDGKIDSAPLKGSSQFLASYCSNGVTLYWDSDAWVKVVNNENDVVAVCNLYFGQQAEYGLTSKEESFTAGQTGNYKIEIWGAEGNYNGGNGAYATGTIQLNKNETIYIHVGGAASRNTGGYNGGGNMPTGSGGAGGGATSVAFVQGKLNELYDYKGSLSENEQYYISNDIIMVAAGGGGGTSWSGPIYGGNGGGYKSVTRTGGSSRVSGSTTYAWGATQTGILGTTTYSWSGRWNETGAFGQGGRGTGASEGGAGGGAGWYGGGGGFDITPGAGGSSYIANPRLFNKKMVTNTTDESLISNDTETKTEITNCVSSEPTSNCAKTGNGYFKITYLSSFVSNNKLTSLSVENNVLRDGEGNAIAFDPDVHTYYVNTNKVSVKINATVDNNKSVISGAGNVNIGFGTTDQVITVGDGIIDDEVYHIIFNVNEVIYDYLGSEETFVVPEDGTYKIETWGAQGGSSDGPDGNGYVSEGVGGYGGYSTGLINLNKNALLYINVGGVGESIHSTTSDYHQAGGIGGYNGGGTGGIGYSGSFGGGAGGGGATSITALSGELEELIDYKGYLSTSEQYYVSNKIIMVAGGGGGGSRSLGSSAGGAAAVNLDSVTLGGTQISGYTFGLGGDGGVGIAQSGSANGSGGGGGGFFGGFAYTANTTSKSRGGAGGSGYIANPSLYNKKMFMYSDENDYISNDIETKTEITDCVSSKPTSNCAKEGAGYARITLVGNENNVLINSLSVDNHDLLDEENNVINFDNNRTTYYVIANTDTINISYEADETYTVLNAGEHELGLGNNIIQVTVTSPYGFIKIFTLNVYLDNIIVDYTGTEKAIPIYNTGTYKIEVWGASGGNAPKYSGGYGGYSTGYAALNKDETIYVNVGGVGSGSSSTVVTGGYNGGGNGHGGRCGQYANRNGSSGGGATSISTVSGVLSTLESYKGTLNDNGTPEDETDDYYESNKIIIVAAGGGGAYNIDNWIYGAGGHAGGYIGNRGTHNKQDTIAQYATGGTQTSVGLPGDAYTSLSERSEYFFGLTSGKFGKGGDTTTWDCLEGGGGGGGFYGGGSGSETSGAAGSGYIASPRVSNKAMYCYGCAESNVVATKTISTTGSNKDSSNCPSGYSGSPLTHCAKSGNGYAKITLIDKVDYTINSITVDNHNLYDINNSSTEFKSDIYEYNVTAKTDIINISYDVDALYTVLNAGQHELSVGTNKINVIVIADNGDTLIYTFNIFLESKEYEYTGNQQVINIIQDGTYKLEVWGAEGGSYNSTYIGGYGSYSEGNISLNKNEKIYLNIGGAGTNCKGPSCEQSGGYNGGGICKAYGDHPQVGCSSGGGATSIAKVSGELNTLTDHKGVLSQSEDYYISNDIIIVAGGGGGGTYTNTENNGSGGSAGGYVGITAKSTARDGYKNGLGLGGSQTSPGGLSNGETGYVGFFGAGYPRISSDYGSTYNAAGAGGGFFGGGGSRNSAAGGGSGYIANPKLFNKKMVIYSDDENYISTNTETKTDITTCINSTPTSECAKSGNGYARITILKNDANSIGLDITNISVENLDLKDKYGNIVVFNKNIKEYYVDSSSEVVNIIYNISSAYQINNAGEHTLLLGNNKILVNVTTDTNEILTYTFNIYLESINVDYTGTEKELNILNSGNYKLEVWGASGGNYDETYHGGYGGYSLGTINLTKNDSLFINVGGAGTMGSRNGGLIAGGYNGGGIANNDDWHDNSSSSGGGATHIATSSGLLSTLENNKNSIIIVAGGGGGTVEYYNNSAQYGYGVGGSGGGFKGADGNETNYEVDGSTFGGNSTGGTQTNSGKNGLFKTSWESDNSTENTENTFGKASEIATTETAVSGGGGGYYGGGNGIVTPAGGGSGYIGNTNLNEKVMYCYDCEESDDISTKTISTTGANKDETSCPDGYDSTPTINCAKSGHGYARITYLNEEILLINNISIKDNDLLDMNGNVISFDSNVNDYYVDVNNSNTIEIEYDVSDLYTVQNAGVHHLSLGTTDFPVIVTTNKGNIYLYVYHITLNSLNLKYTSNYQNVTIPENGTYKIELWGASGGDSDNSLGGKGSYTSGVLTLNKNDNLYFYVGEKGANNQDHSSYNGGGAVYASNLSTGAGGGGGGATDVRIFTSTPSQSDLDVNSNIGLNSRIMVAGAGGGAAGGVDALYPAGANAGGLIGNDGIKDARSFTLVPDTLGISKGGTQVSGGSKSACGYGYSRYYCTENYDGSFGKGGDSASSNGDALYQGGGGGAGYYGGGGGATGYSFSGAGGSSFISGHTGCVAITADDDSTPKSDCETGTTSNNCSIHYSNYVFTNTKMIDGSGYAWTNEKVDLEQMPNPQGGLYSEGVGHTGNGYARITKVN